MNKQKVVGINNKFVIYLFVLYNGIVIFET